MRAGTSAVTSPAKRQDSSDVACAGSGDADHQGVPAAPLRQDDLPNPAGVSVLPATIAVTRERNPWHAATNLEERSPAWKQRWRGTKRNKQRHRGQQTERWQRLARSGTRP